MESKQRSESESGDEAGFISRGSDSRGSDGRSSETNECKAPKSGLTVLKNRSDFLKIQKSGMKVRSGNWLLVAYCPNDFGYPRCGWTLPRKVGSAVIRNKLKRWTRAFFREQLAHKAPPGDSASHLKDISAPDYSKLSFDLNVVFLKTTDDFYKKLDYERFSKQMDKALSMLRKRR